MNNSSKKMKLSFSRFIETVPRFSCDTNDICVFDDELSEEEVNRMKEQPLPEDARTIDYYQKYLQLLATAQGRLPNVTHTPSTSYDPSIEESAAKRPRISEREENDRQIFHTYVNGGDDIRNHLPKEDISFAHYNDPLSIAACMFTKCPLCNISKSGSNVFYLSPCQHRICRLCWLKKCDSNFRAIKRRCLGKGKRVALCPCHFCRGRTPPRPSCPTCDTKVTDFFMFYRKGNCMGKLAHFSALPRRLQK